MDLSNELMDDYLEFKALVEKHKENYGTMLDRRDKAQLLLNQLFMEIGKHHTIEHIK